MSRKKYDRRPIDLNYVSVSDAIAELEKARDSILSEYPEVEHITLDISAEEEYGNSYINAGLEFERKETKEERKRRLANQKRIKEMRKKQYLRLKREFEPDDS